MHFHEMFELLLDGVVVIDPKTTKAIICNKAAFLQLEYSRNEYEKLTILDFEAQKSQKEVQKHIENILKNGRDEFETKHKTKSGKILDVKVTAVSYMIENKSYLLCTFRDITEQKSIERKLKQSEERLEVATESGEIGVWEYNVVDNHLIWNDQMYKIYGIKRDDFVGAYDAWMSALHQDDLKQSTELFAKALQDPNTLFNPEFRIILPDGSIRNIQANSKIIRDKEGNPLSAIGVNFDITNLKDTEQALRKSEEQFRVIFEKANCGIAYGDHTGKLLLCNDYFASMVKYDREEVQSMNFAELTHPDDLVAELPLFEDIASQKTEGYRIQKRYVCKDGEIIWVDLATSVVRDENGTPLNYLGVVINITKEKLLEEEIKEKEKRFRDVADASGEYIWELNTDGEYTFLTKPFEDMLGYTLDESLGRNPFSFMPKDEQIRVGDYFMNEVVAKGIAFKGLTHRSLTKDGKTVWQKVNGLPMFDKAGNIIGYRGAALDITAEKKVSEDLKAAKEKAEAASRAKTEFLANMSHEIRTPMNAVIGLGDILGDMIEEPKQRDILNKINSSSKMLLGVINGILDYSKIEEGKLELEYNKFKIEDILTQLKVMFEEKAVKKGLQLSFYSKTEGIESIVGDELRLTQVLTNLLSNAIKFTHSGSVTVSIELLKKHSTNKATFAFCVKDNGIGINQKEIKKLFQPFAQADSSTTRKYGGTGLGLVISKNIINAMGSTIEVESQLDKGSRFFFALDLDIFEHKSDMKIPYATSEKTSLKTESSNTDLSALCILVVEDNEINQEVVSLMLQKVGIDYDLANNGEEGLKKFLADQKKYDLILMDLQMPIMSGYEATKEIRKYNKQIPIVALTAAAMIEDKDKAIKVGMNEHIAKPVERNKLYQVISKLCTVKFEYTTKIKKDSKKVLDKEYLYNTTGSQDSANHLLLKFKTQLKEGEFRDIEDSIKADTKEAHKQVHSLKGVSGNIGAFELCEILTLIDKKYKRQEEIDKIDIQILISAKEKLLVELESIVDTNPQDIEYEKLSIEELKDFIQEIKSLLEGGDLIEEEQLQKLYGNLKQIVPSQELAKYKELMEDFEFDGALEYLKKWESNHLI
jgi:PAS domain S-box-containing protein